MCEALEADLSANTVYALSAFVHITRVYSEVFKIKLAPQKHFNAFLKIEQSKTEKRLS